MVYSFTAEELSKYDGVKDEKIYFSVRGTVYDVSSAPDFYGPGPRVNTAADTARSVKSVNERRAIWSSVKSHSDISACFTG